MYKYKKYFNIGICYKNNNLFMCLNHLEKSYCFHIVYIMKFLLECPYFFKISLSLKYKQFLL